MAFYQKSCAYQPKDDETSVKVGAIDGGGCLASRFPYAVTGWLSLPAAV
jgi:hypothetical protein